MHPLTQLISYPCRAFIHRRGENCGNKEMNPCTYCPTVAPRTFFGKLLLSLKAAIASGLLLQSISLPALSAPLLGALDQEIYLNIPENTQLEEALIDWGVAANM